MSSRPTTAIPPFDPDDGRHGYLYLKLADRLGAQFEAGDLVPGEKPTQRAKSL